MTVLLLYTATVTPYRVCFVDTDTAFWVVLSYVTDFLFFADVFVNCFSAYFDEEDNIITDHKKIIINYATGWMLLDIFACIPFQIVLGSGAKWNNIVRVARLPRLYRLVKIAKLMR